MDLYMPAGVAQSWHAYSEHVGKMTDTRTQKAKQNKSIKNADQALTVCGEHADLIVGSPSW